MCMEVTPCSQDILNVEVISNPTAAQLLKNRSGENATCAVRSAGRRFYGRCAIIIQY